MTKVKDGSIKLLYTIQVSPKARKRMIEQLKYEKLHRRTDRIEQLAKCLHAKVSGWIAYFGKYAQSSMHHIYAHINRRLVKWCMWKYRKFKRQALHWLYRKWEEKPHMFIHWQQTRWFCYY